MIRLLLIAVLLAIVVSSGANAQQVVRSASVVVASHDTGGMYWCPKCGQWHRRPVANAVAAVASAVKSTGQAIAQARANYMAANHLRRHPPRSAGDWASVGSFEGVGWNSNPNAPHSSVATCVPGSRGGGTHGQSDFDAVARGPRGTYRVRIWR